MSVIQEPYLRLTSSKTSHLHITQLLPFFRLSMKAIVLGCLTGTFWVIWKPKFESLESHAFPLHFSSGIRELQGHVNC